MAGLIFEVNMPSTALTAATPTVVGFITTPANQRVRLKAYGFFFDGTTNSATPVEIKLARPTTVGTLTAGGTAIKTEPGLPETVQSTVGLAASVQPTLAANVVYKTITVHPQLGYEYIAPLGEEEQIAGGTSWVASATAQAGVNLRGYYRAEE
ncbi:MAG TPA: hypothetical protein VKA15_13690 [Isosphaeraceae bacterium]|nr:hypothetical protein [Isosphaeraceae bacterium]